MQQSTRTKLKQELISFLKKSIYLGVENSDLVFFSGSTNLKWTKNKRLSKNRIQFTMNPASNQHTQTGPLKLCGKLIAQQTQQSCSRYRYEYGSSLKSPLPRTHSLDDELIQAKQSLQLLKAHHPQLTEQESLNYSVLTDADHRKRILREFYTNPYYIYAGSEFETLPALFPNLTPKPKIAPPSKFKLVPVIQTPACSKHYFKHSCECSEEHCCKSQHKHSVSPDDSETFVIIELQKNRPNTKLKRVKVVTINDDEKPPSQTERQASKKQPRKKTAHGNVKCPICNRIFHHSVGDRHVQFCQYLQLRNQQQTQIR